MTVGSHAQLLFDPWHPPPPSPINTVPPGPPHPSHSPPFSHYSAPPPVPTHLPPFFITVPPRSPPTPPPPHPRSHPLTPSLLSLQFPAPPPTYPLPLIPLLSLQCPHVPPPTHPPPFHYSAPVPRSPPTHPPFSLQCPRSPVILWQGSASWERRPLSEGSRQQLTCRSVGGRPPPVLTWWRQGTRLPQRLEASTDVASGKGMVEVTASVTASRDLQGATLTCHAQTPLSSQTSKTTLIQPRTASVALNITLPPLDVQILGSGVAVSAGTMLRLVCAASDPTLLQSSPGGADTLISLPSCTP
ncbi:hypothetical protein C7M84_005809 [Penaeus vannamei]|uniref:Ig-like domain-containing protein n=1 Tax=Penaeus vannamei TaxID=6689 RepID=A0A423TGR4_PENVA|nr:hypothetical protein C7M84_005809 [Penaeus vannamei]